MSNNIEAPREANDLFVDRGQFPHGEKLAHVEVGVRVLPLGEFSEFILTEQPRLLTAIRAENIGVDSIIQRQREILASLNPEVVETAIATPTLARVAMLDLTFGINAVVLSGGIPPDEVEQLSSRLVKATGLPRTMTFEKIVTINSSLPFEHIRTFTDGGVGKTERMFYYGHELMDTRLQDTTRVVTDAVTALTTSGKSNVGDTEVLLTRGVRNMAEFIDYMQGFFRMPTEHFAIFRQYISQYPDGTRNASAAFIGMPRLCLRLVGSAPFYEQFLDLGMPYFPITEQSDINKARINAQEDNYLVVLCERLQPPEGKIIASMLFQLVDSLHQFRLLHFAAVLKYVPGAIPEGGKDLKALLAEDYESILEDQSDVVKGTGGFISGPLLRNILRLDLRSLARLKAIIDEGELP